MLASVTGIITENDQTPTYNSACGIQQLAFEKVLIRSEVTAYSTMGLFLVAEDVATAWYHNMISGPAGQTKWGSIEG